MPSSELVPVETIQQRIYFVRGKRVMLDADLARFYGVTTGHLNRAVLRNADRFPEDFAFRLARAELAILKCQFGISKTGHGGSRSSPTVFTEQGIAMLASVLRTRRAALVSVAIVRAFVRLRELLAGNQRLAVKLAELEHKLGHHDAAIREIFETIRQLLAPPPSRSKRAMGFHARLLPKAKVR